MTDKELVARFFKEGYENRNFSFVLDCMAENTTKIKNMRQYLLAALYNAPMTINSYYASLAQHDIASGRI